MQYNRQISSHGTNLFPRIYVLFFFSFFIDAYRLKLSLQRARVVYQLAFPGRGFSQLHEMRHLKEYSLGSDLWAASQHFSMEISFHFFSGFDHRIVLGLWDQPFFTDSLVCPMMCLLTHAPPSYRA